jgi:hypothetical protein
VKLVREPGAGNLHARFDERGGETERWTSRRAQQRKTPRVFGAAGPARHRASPRLYQATKLQAENLRLDKEDDGGRWLLSYALDSWVTLRLRISVGGPADWYCFSAEVQMLGAAPVVVGTFDIAPIEISCSALARPMEVKAWNPQDEPDFLLIPAEYLKTFALMVRAWGRLASVVVPASAWLTVH